MRTSITSAAAARTDIAARRHAGETLASIAKSYGVSRERIRQICQQLGVSPEENDEEMVRQAVALLRSQDISVEDAAVQAGLLTATRLRTRAKRLGIDLAAAREEGRTHRFDGQVFGLWSVMAGSYDPSSDNHHKRSVECRCACGTVRRVLVHNLIGGLSQGCGCRNSTGDRKHVPWICHATGQRFETTADLARHLQVNYLALVRRRNRGEAYVDASGNAWEALPEEAVPHTPGADTAIPWVDLDSGETWRHAGALAEHLGLASQNIWRMVYEGRAYCSADGRAFAPVDRAGSLARKPRGPWAPATVWRCVETGETWPTRRACAAALGISATTLGNWADRGGYVDAQGHHYLPAPQKEAA